MLSGLVLTVTAVGNILLAVTVLAKDYKKPLHWALAAVSASLTAWLVAGYFSNLNTGIPLFWNRAVFIGPIVAPVALTIFVQELSKSKQQFNKRQRVLFIGLALLFLASLATPVFVRDIQERTVDGVLEGYDLIRGPLYYLFIIYLGAALIFATKTLYESYKTSTGSEKTQLQHVLLGTGLAASWSIFFSVVLVLLTQSSRLSTFGPLSGLILVSFYSYAIIKHKLFDIRLVVARSLGYLLSISALGLVYGFLAFNLINDLLFSNSNVTVWQRTAYTILAVTIAITFQPLKRFFDRWTNRFFYQDAYDGQALIDELNQTLVSTIELDKMLRSSAETLERNIKPEFCVFGLQETAYEGLRIIGNSQKKFGYQDISFAKLKLPQMNQKVIVTDYLEESHKELQAKMRKNDVAVLVRLTTDVNVEGIGAIALGPKKSGNAYNSQDIKVLEIVANSLVIAMDNALRFEEIQKFNITLEQKVEDATRKLRRANEKLVAMDQTKDDFISMASHQLRTPLTSVKGYLSMVLEGDAGKVTPKQQKMLSQAFTSSQRMVYLIADLLNVSRLRTGKFVIEPKPTNLADVVEGEIQQLVETAKARGLKLSYDKPKRFPEYMLDETKIRQVIMNFTDNAIHYTKAGGSVRVALKETPLSVEFTVTDNGIGVPRHEQHHLFTKFFRAGNARKARPDGTGLGLFMAKKVVIAQGGSIIFKSQENKGSTFGFTFAKSRLKQPDSSADQPVAAAQPQLARSQPAAAAKETGISLPR